MARLFGTDGVRGVANETLTPEFALALASAAALVLTNDRPGHRATAVVGRDPRPSGDFIAAAVVAGLTASGVDVDLCGVIPTPAVAHLTDSRQADFGVVVSASHNPMPDNGIKFFGQGGTKLSVETEDAIAAALTAGEWSRPQGAGVGRVLLLREAHRIYAEHLGATVRDVSLAGLKVVLDLANGAATCVTPEVFRALGAQVVTIHGETDGVRINDGAGSTHLADIRAAVVRERADLGFAFDGDADRVLAVDAGGSDVDGDQIMGLLAIALQAQGRLTGDRIAATVMSNLGLTLAMREAGIDIVRCAVGDRNVLAAMDEHDIVLGGEQSGHIVIHPHATTGDGALTALAVAAEVSRSGRPLAELASVVGRLPQVLVNVSGVDTSSAEHPDVTAAVADAEAALGETGRVLLRPSGTEPLVRVMVEAPTREQAQAIADDLADVVRRVGS